MGPLHICDGNPITGPDEVINNIVSYFKSAESPILSVSVHFCYLKENTKGALGNADAMKPKPERAQEVKYMKFEICKRVVFNVFRLFLWFNEKHKNRAE